MHFSQGVTTWYPTKLPQQRHAIFCILQRQCAVIKMSGMAAIAVGSGASVENNDIVLSASRIARIARRHTSSPQVLHSRMYTIFLQKLGLILSFSISWGLPRRFQFLYDDNNNLQTPQEKKKSSATDGGFSPAFRRTMTETLKSHTPGVTFL